MKPSQAATSSFIVNLICNSEMSSPAISRRLGPGGGVGKGQGQTSSLCLPDLPQHFGKAYSIFPDWPRPPVPFESGVMGCRAQTSHSPGPRPGPQRTVPHLEEQGTACFLVLRAAWDGLWSGKGTGWPTPRIYITDISLLLPSLFQGSGCLIPKGCALNHRWD